MWVVVFELSNGAPLVIAPYWEEADAKAAVKPLWDRHRSDNRIVDAYAVKANEP